tara:strand:+ start:227 stop:484 length:258 start_codon:yes stop_codon:yes gene_type:complete
VDISQEMKKLFLSFIILFSINPTNAVTTRMFRVLDTCARYRLNEIDAIQALEKLKLENKKINQIEAKAKIKKYCSVFTPNEKIEF